MLTGLNLRLIAPYPPPSSWFALRPSADYVQIAECLDAAQPLARRPLGADLVDAHFPAGSLDLPNG